MKKILIVVSIYRVGERMYPTIVKLSEQYDVDILKVAQMGILLNGMVIMILDYFLIENMRNVLIIFFIHPRY